MSNVDHCFWFIFPSLSASSSFASLIILKSHNPLVFPAKRQNANFFSCLLEVKFAPTLMHLEQ